MWCVAIWSQWVRLITRSALTGVVWVHVLYMWFDFSFMQIASYIAAVRCNVVIE